MTPRRTVEQFVFLPREGHVQALHRAALGLVRLDCGDRRGADLALLLAVAVLRDHQQDEPVVGQRGRHLDHAVRVRLRAFGESENNGVLLGQTNDDSARRVASEEVALLVELDRVLGVARRGGATVLLVEAEALVRLGQHERRIAEVGLRDHVRENQRRERGESGDRDANGVEVVALSVSGHECLLLLPLSGLRWCGLAHQEPDTTYCAVMYWRATSRFSVTA
jgi:hypothetical protein